jgi:hypothetical protein
MKRLRTFSAIVAVLVGVTIAQPPASAQDADSQEVMRYTLTDAGLAKYIKATQNVKALPGGIPENCEGDEDSDSDSTSISDVAAKMDAIPGVKAAIQSAGMTTREYVVFMFSVVQNSIAAWALSQPGGKLPPGVSKANVDFVKRHETEMAALGDGDPCGGDSNVEEEPEE